MSAIEESIDVGVPARVAYDQWTRFEQYPRFMEGVEEVTQVDDRRLHWVAEVAGRRAEWDAEIIEQIPDERIIWASIGGVRSSGGVTFQPIDPDTTRIVLEMDVDPPGTAGSVADALGVVRRRVRGDLERFRDLVEDRGEPTGAWRGTIRAGEEPDERVAGDRSGAVAAGAAGAGAGGLVGRDAMRDDERLAEELEWGESADERPGHTASIGRIKGAPVVDQDGDRVGKVSDVFVEMETGFLRFISVSTGWLDRSGHLLRLDDVSIEDVEGDTVVRVPYTREQLRHAPTLGDEEEVTPEREHLVGDYFDHVGDHDAAREAIRARQTAPAPTPEIARAELETNTPEQVRVKRWGT